LFPFGNTGTFQTNLPYNPNTHGARMDLRDVQRQVDAYIGQFKEGYFPPLVNLARLTEEVGELARELNHRYGPKTKKPGEPDQDIALELADIVFVCVVLANQMGLDLQDAIERTLHKYEVRDADRWERK
jgi:NTP pyrophosphatase (non-canonical NTP hydrolase)